MFESEAGLDPTESVKRVLMEAVDDVDPLRWQTKRSKIWGKMGITVVGFEAHHEHQPAPGKREIYM